MRGSPIQGFGRALALISLAGEPMNLGQAAEMLQLAAERLELAESEIIPQQQQQLQSDKDC